VKLETRVQALIQEKIFLFEIFLKPIINLFFKSNNICTFKYHVSRIDGKILVRINLLLYLFSPSSHLTLVCFFPAGLSLLIQHFQQVNHRKVNTLEEVEILKAASSKNLLNDVIAGQNDPIYKLLPSQ
jgi:hypothetical protein